ncbi:MAG: hypothetical protein IJS31_02600 [Oscillospiraceae bacterium]|nr:hypothetical protein [Oscillospiraceae bacterium]
MDYKDLYFFLFGKLADAAETPENGNEEKALSILINAQREAEEAYLQMTETE